MVNKYSIELDLPVIGSEDGIEESLALQAQHLVENLRAIFAVYKKEGIAVPTISCRNPKKPKVKKETLAEEYKEFRKTLIDHHLQYMPNDDLIAQNVAIKRLYATGMSADRLIALYEKHRQSYQLTTWTTVKYWLGKNPEGKEDDSVFIRKEISDEEKADLITRLKSVS